MKKNKITIIIAGETATGKSTVTFLLKKFLREQGFEVEYSGSSDHSNETEFDNANIPIFDRAIDVIKEKSKIILQEQQLCRQGFEGKSTHKVVDVVVDGGGKTEIVFRGSYDECQEWKHEHGFSYYVTKLR